MYNIIMLNRMIFLMNIINIIALFLMLFLMSPSDLGPIGILVFFVMLYLLFFGIVVFFMNFFVKIFFSRGAMIKKDYINSGIIAILPVMILVLIASGVRNISILASIPTLVIILNVFLFSKITET